MLVLVTGLRFRTALQTQAIKLLGTTLQDAKTALVALFVIG